MAILPLFGNFGGSSADPSGSLLPQLNQEINNRIAGDSNLAQQIGVLAGGSHVVLKENFISNTGTTYQLTGAITNGTFVSGGGWQNFNILNTLASSVTTTAGGVLYDNDSFFSYFTRHRINVNSISPGGSVSLDYGPPSGKAFSVWYWYNLQVDDRLDDYYRDDYVASIEESTGDLATSIKANVVAFNGILDSSDDTVQKALDTLDDHDHDNRYTLLTSTAALTSNLQSQINSAVSVNNTQSNQISSLQAITGNYTLLTTTALLTSNLQSQISSISSDFRYIESLSSGIISGGILSINANPLLFNVDAGTGVIVDNWTNPTFPVIYNVSWPTTNSISATYLATNSVTWVGVDKTGSIYQFSGGTEPSNDIRRHYILLGKLAHYTNTSISFISPHYDVFASPIEQLRDFLQTFNLINLGINVTYASNNLTIKSSSGNLFGQGINFQANPSDPHKKFISSQNPITFQYRLQNGTSYSNTNNIDPLNYDLNGVLTPVSNASSVTNQRIYIFPTGNIRIQYGQHQYSNMSDAIAGIASENFTTYQSITEDSVLIGILSVTRNTTDLSNTQKAIFTNFGRFGDTGAGGGAVGAVTLQSAYNNSSVPEIITNSTLDGFAIQRGSNSDSDKVLYILNGNGNIVSQFDGLGNATFVSISGNANNLVAHNIDGTLIDAGLPISALTPLTVTATVSSNLLNGFNKTLSYDDGILQTLTSQLGVKSFSYDVDGKLVSISGTGDYKSKSFGYTGDNLTSITVI